MNTVAELKQIMKQLPYRDLNFAGQSRCLLNTKAKELLIDDDFEATKGDGYFLLNDPAETVLETLDDDYKINVMGLDYSIWVTRWEIVLDETCKNGVPPEEAKEYRLLDIISQAIDALIDDGWMSSDIISKLEITSEEFCSFVR